MQCPELLKRALNAQRLITYEPVADITSLSEQVFLALDESHNKIGHMLFQRLKGIRAAAGLQQSC